MHLCLTDTRNPGKWLKADRARPCERAIVSFFWTFSPFGMRNVMTMPQIQPGVFRVDGKPAGPPDTFNAQFGALVDSRPDWSMVGGQRITIWQSGNQAVSAFDLSRLDVVEAWTDHILAHFAPWTNSIFLDYATDLAWLAPLVPLSYWKQWNAGYALAMMRLRRSGMIVGGQQYHLTPLTPYTTWLYHEESPGHFGLSFADHERNMAKYKEEAFHQTLPWTFEIRYPEKWAASYINQCLDFIERNNCFLSWGRDATALVGVPIR